MRSKGLKAFWVYHAWYGIMWRGTCVSDSCRQTNGSCCQYSYLEDGGGVGDRCLTKSPASRAAGVRLLISHAPCMIHSRFQLHWGAEIFIVLNLVISWIVLCFLSFSIINSSLEWVFVNSASRSLRSFWIKNQPFTVCLGKLECILIGKIIFPDFWLTVLHD